MKSNLIIFGLLWGSIAWAETTQETLIEAFQTADHYPSSRAELIADADLSDGDLQLMERELSWEVRLQAQVVQIWRRDPDRAKLCWSSKPGITRNGMPRFAGEPWRGPEAASLLLERFIQGSDDTETRAALIAGLQHTDGDWSEAVVSLLETEPESRIREVMADVLRHADAGVVWEGLTHAAADPEAEVRAAAMRSIGSRADGADGTALLLTALSDENPQVRGMAAKSTGWLKIEQSYEVVRPLITDENPDVRLHALRAIRRIDEPRTAKLSELQQLQEDSSDKVRRLAEGIAQP